MDLSAVIFVALALAWAVYLIPKALKHHDEMASDRLVEGHSDKVRILSRKAKAVVADVAEAVTPAPESAAARTTPEPAAAHEPALDAVAGPKLTRAGARKAAQRRRRVLGVLVAILLVVWGLTWAAYLPIWAPGVPGALVVAWLVMARLSVRSQQQRRVARPATAAPVSIDSAPQMTREDSSSASNAEVFLDELADENTTGLAREQLEAVLADDGSLWDPLPMTLPTYVNKARARRTVRTIELTGMTSSGHDDTDTALAREAQESAQKAAQESAEAEQAAQSRRRAAGA